VFYNLFENVKVILAVGLALSTHNSKNTMWCIVITSSEKEKKRKRNAKEKQCNQALKCHIHESSFRSIVKHTSRLSQATLESANECNG